MRVITENQYPIVSNQQTQSIKCETAAVNCQNGRRSQTKVINIREGNEIEQIKESNDYAYISISIDINKGERQERGSRQSSKGKVQKSNIIKEIEIVHRLSHINLQEGK